MRVNLEDEWAETIAMMFIAQLLHLDYEHAVLASRFM